MLERIGNCKIIEEVGAGGMAVVYKGVQEPLGRVVAIKALKSTRLSSAEDRARFHREAQAISRIDHPNVVMLFEVVEAEEGVFLVLQYVRGRTLRELMQAGPISVEEALSIASDVASGLGAAHALGLVHRDVKPENVMVTPEGRAKTRERAPGTAAAAYPIPRRRRAYPRSTATAR